MICALLDSVFSRSYRGTTVAQKEIGMATKKSAPPPPKSGGKKKKGC